MRTLAALSTGEVGAVVVLGVLTLGAGLALLYDGVRRARFRRRARTAFERVDATVVDAAVHEPATGGPEAVPHVEYEYTVDGETYVSRSLWPTMERAPPEVDRRDARRIVEDYPVGRQVIAHYDPANPAVSYLIDQVDPTRERLELVVGGALVAGFVALLWSVTTGAL